MQILTLLKKIQEIQGFNEENGMKWKLLSQQRVRSSRIVSIDTIRSVTQNLVSNTPYSKMAANFSILLFDCKLAHLASLSNVKFKRIFTLNEGKRASLQSNKRILKWRPFWNKVYNLTRVKLPLLPDKGLTLETSTSQSFFFF